MIETIQNILFAPLADSPLLLIVAILYFFVESIRIYDARLIQGHTHDFQSKVLLRAKGRQLPKWVGYVHFLGWVLFIIMLITNWKFAIVYFICLFVLRVFPILENIGEFLMRNFMHNNDGNINTTDDSLENSRNSEQVNNVIGVNGDSDSNTLTIRKAKFIFDVICDENLDKSSRKDHQIFAIGGYNEFQVSMALKLNIANEFLLLSQIFEKDDTLEKAFSNALSNYEHLYLDTLEDFATIYEIDNLYKTNTESIEFKKILATIRRRQTGAWTKNGAFLNDDFIESLTSFGNYCKSLGVKDPDYWQRIYNRLGLDYTTSCPNGNKPFID